MVAPGVSPGKARRVLLSHCARRTRAHLPPFPVRRTLTWTTSAQKVAAHNSTAAIGRRHGWRHYAHHLGHRTAARPDYTNRHLRWALVQDHGSARIRRAHRLQQRPTSSWGSRPRLPSAAPFRGSYTNDPCPSPALRTPARLDGRPPYSWTCSAFPTLRWTRAKLPPARHCILTTSGATGRP